VTYSTLADLANIEGVVGFLRHRSNTRCPEHCSGSRRTAHVRLGFGGIDNASPLNTTLRQCWLLNHNNTIFLAVNNNRTTCSDPAKVHRYDPQTIAPRFQCHRSCESRPRESGHGLKWNGCSDGRG
jgi:hypothetical protein